jgi:hypothetical protein
VRDGRLLAVAGITSALLIGVAQQEVGELTPTAVALDWASRGSPTMMRYTAACRVVSEQRAEAEVADRLPVGLRRLP